MTTKITTTPSPLEVVDKINAVIDDATNLSTTVGNKLDKTGKAADAVKADTATTAGNVTGTVAVANGGTGATTAANARTNLGLSTAFTNASISGKVITLTKADGTTKTLTTQDTVPSSYITAQAHNYRKWSDGTLEMWGYVAANNTTDWKTATFPVALTTTTNAYVLTTQQGEPYPGYSGSEWSLNTVGYCDFTTTTLRFFQWGNANWQEGTMWYAKGKWK